MECEFGSGARVVFSYGKSESPFGCVLAVLLGRAFVHLSFLESAEDERGRLAYAAACLKSYHPLSRFVEEDVTSAVSAAFSAYMRGKKMSNVLLIGPPSHERVWRAVRNVRFGETALCEDIAHEAGLRNSVRMCGRIVASNPVACFVPCHRVISNGREGVYYRWGKTRQRALLEFEAECKSSLDRERDASLGRRRSRPCSACGTVSPLRKRPSQRAIGERRFPPSPELSLGLQKRERDAQGRLVGGVVSGLPIVPPRVGANPAG